VLTLTASDTLTDFPGCGGQDFVRASLFGTGRFTGRFAQSGGAPSQLQSTEREAWLAETKKLIENPGDYLAYEENDELEMIPLTLEWTRIGRSLAANVRFDDPTVSRRHALLERQPGGIRVLDDRSLNGVFVNGERVDGRMLKDGDEIVIGRYHLSFLSIAPQPASAPTSLHTVS